MSPQRIGGAGSGRVEDTTPPEAEGATAAASEATAETRTGRGSAAGERKLAALATKLPKNVFADIRAEHEKLARTSPRKAKDLLAGAEKLAEFLGQNPSHWKLFEAIGTAKGGVEFLSGFERASIVLQEGTGNAIPMYLDCDIRGFAFLDGEALKHVRRGLSMSQRGGAFFEGLRSLSAEVAKPPRTRDPEKAFRDGLSLVANGLSVTTEYERDDLVRKLRSAFSGPGKATLGEANAAKLGKLLDRAADIQRLLTAGDTPAKVAKHMEKLGAEDVRLLLRAATGSNAVAPAHVDFLMRWGAANGLGEEGGLAFAGLATGIGGPVTRAFIGALVQKGSEADVRAVMAAFNKVDGLCGWTPAIDAMTGGPGAAESPATIRATVEAGAATCKRLEAGARGDAVAKGLYKALGADQAILAEVIR